MKKHLENMASAMPVHKVSEGVTECSNLRPRPDGGLETVGMPVRIAGKDMVPLTMAHLADGTRRLIMADGLSVYDADPDIPDSCRPIAELESVPSAAITDAGGDLTLLTEKGPFSLRYDMASGNWNCLGMRSAWPPVVIRADDHAELSAVVEPFALTGTYPHCSEPVSAADTALVTARLSAAVEKITEAAGMAGRYIHPRLMAYRILDSGGRCVYRSVPVWVGPEGGGFGLCSMIGADLTRQSGGICSVGSFSVSAPAYKIAVDIPRQLHGDIAQYAAVLEILASPPLTPYRPRARAGCRLRAVDQNTGRLEAYVPDTSNGMMPLSGLRAQMVGELLERFWQSAEIVDTVSRPFCGGSGSDSGSRYVMRQQPGLTAAGEAERLAQVLAVPVAAVAPGSGIAFVDAAAAPHSFTAASVLQAADMNVYSGLSVLRGSPPDALVLASGDTVAVTPADAAARYTAVEFSDGSGDTAVTADLSAAALPLSVGPVIVYPDPDASFMTVAVRGTNGVASRVRIPLQRSPSGRYAFYIDPQLKPVPLLSDGTPFTLPADRRRPRSRPGTVAVAYGSDPLDLLFAVTASSAEVHRVVPAVRSSSSWDFGRQHLLVFAADGICTMSVDSRRSSAAVNRLYPVGVSRPDAVTAAPDAVYAVLSSGALVRVSGSRIYSLDPQAGAVAAVWCAVRDELWLALSDGSVRIMDPAAGTSYTRTFGPVLSFHDPGGVPYAAAPAGLYDLGREKESWSIPVAWSVRMPAPYRTMARRLSVDMQGADVDIELSLRADNGPGASSSLPVTRLRLNGSVNAPLHVRLAAPERRWLKLAVRGLAGPGTSISRWAIYLMDIRNRPDHERNHK